MNKHIARIFKTVVKFGITAVALYFVFSNIEFANVIALYKKSNPFYLILALLFFVLSKVLSSYRLNIFFRQEDLYISNLTNLKLYLLGMFYNLFLPGGISGDGYKIYLLQKNFKTGTRKLFGAVLSDRLSGMTALLVITSLLVLIVSVRLSYKNLAILIIPIVLLGLYYFFKWIYPLYTKVYFKTILYSAGVQVLQLICTYFIIIALPGGDHVLPYLIVFLVSSIVTVLPISVGGVGVRELTFLYGAQLLNIDTDLAVGVSLMFYIITAVVSFIGIRYVIKPVNFSKQENI